MLSVSKLSRKAGSGFARKIKIKNLLLSSQKESSPKGF
jgi:hypothetical protein